MRSTALVFVLLATKLAVLPLNDLVASRWSLVAYAWQDAALVVAFALFEMTTHRAPRLTWVGYAVVAGYVAMTVPVVRALGTPLTWPMWRAAGGPLADSILYYATVQNLMRIGSIVAIAAIAPRLLRHIPALATAAALVPLVVLGPRATSRVDTHGRDRNAWSALALSSIPRVSAVASSSEDWRATRADRTPLEDLTGFTAIAAGQNVILISLESTAAQYLGLYGATPDPAPHLTALAKKGLVFERAYAVYPESIKGLFSMLCSSYPAFDRRVERYATAPCRSLALVLAKHGYHTALFHSGRFAYLGMESVIRNRGYGVLADAGDIGGEHESSFGIDERTTVARMLDWIDGVPPTDPFFLNVPIAGHHPYEASRPGPFPGDDDFGRYRNAVHDGDAAIGALVEGLRARGLDRRTTWIVIGDHGEAFGQHDGNYGHTFQLDEENVHVPFVVVPPSSDRQVRSRRVVSLLDVAPTLLDLAGLPAESGYEGQSALDGRRRMALFFADYSLGLLGLRDGSLKYIYEMESRRSRLFDLDRDPTEAHNLAADHADIANAYSSRLNRWIRRNPSINHQITR